MVDILDNYNDYYYVIEVYDYKEKMNIIGWENLFLLLICKMIFWMIFVFVLMGIGLLFIVGWLLLIMGFYCYLIGIFYLLGLKFLFSLLLGEVFLGFIMGFMIIFICVYINMFEVFNWLVVNLWGIFLVVLFNICYIVNLMLVNNICDLEEDENNKRYILVYYFGKVSFLKLFVGLNIIVMLVILLVVGLGLILLIMLFMFLILFFVWK